MTDTIDATPTTADLRQQAKVVKEDLRGLTSTAKQIAQEKLGEAKNKAAGYAGDVKGKANEYVDEGKQKDAKVEDQVENYIREKPLKSVLIAAGAGVLLGFLLSRR